MFQGRKEGNNMCQTGSKSINKWSMKGYRVYRKRACLGGEVSFYYGCDEMDLGVRTKKGTTEPFHMFRDAKSLVSWTVGSSDLHSWTRGENIVIYECRLSGNLKVGVWENQHDVKTVTGDYCTLLKKVKLATIEKTLKLKNKKGSK